MKCVEPKCEPPYILDDNTTKPCPSCRCTLTVKNETNIHSNTKTTSGAKQQEQEQKSEKICVPTKCDSLCILDNTTKPCPHCNCISSVKNETNQYFNIKITSGAKEHEEEQKSGKICVLSKCASPCILDNTTKPCPSCKYTLKMKNETKQNSSSKPPPGSQKEGYNGEKICTPTKCDSPCILDNTTKPCPRCNCRSSIKKNRNNCLVPNIHLNLKTNFTTYFSYINVLVSNFHQNIQKKDETAKLIVLLQNVNLTAI